LDALLVTVQSPLDISLSSGHKGVFLNQGADWQPPYYSVKATGNQYLSVPSSGRSHYFYFSGWQANPSVGAEFQYPTQTERHTAFE
ncbi:MAG: hypothetical protein L6Q47_16420, partial [Ignavibacteriaceae bacterium]|nr:hypothetical protein [Ignavibacteriaceae bacterium]